MSDDSVRDQNKAVVNRYYAEVLNLGKVDVLDEIAADDYIENNPFPGQGNGRADFKARASYLLGAFAPLSFSVQDVIAENDRVVVRWSSSGRHSGDFMGIPPTDRDYTIDGIDVHRVENGRMAEHWHVVDQLSQMQQLGLLPDQG